MCLKFYTIYDGCYPDCRMSSFFVTHHCERFRRPRDPALGPTDTICTEENGGAIRFQTLHLKQRCRKCVRERLEERVKERKEREEREKEAERRGEKGEVIRRLRMEEDIEAGLTPRVQPEKFVGAEPPSPVEGTPKLLVPTEGEFGLGIYFDV